ncbi:MAG: phosphopantetheine adenylyltransferase [Candidatus Bathyarchaeia archaeon]
MRKFGTVAVGGTFDEFHRGHQALLMKAFEVGERVLIGLSSDEFARELRKPHEVASYKERLDDLKTFLAKHGFSDRAEVVTLHDPYGVTLSGGCVEAIVVSRETESTAHEINKKRRAKGLQPLGIVVIEMVPAENHIPISTTRIRRKEIDREGYVLKN